jgi:hypothetical protein
MIGRSIAPAAADPEEVLYLRIPGPVTRSPDDVIALRPLVGWRFLNGFGRLGLD